MGDVVIILDTNFLYAFYNSNDKNHDRARELYSDVLDGKYGQPILLDYVFDELVTLVQVRSNSNEIATRLGSLVIQDTEDFLQLLMINNSIFNSAWDLFQNQNARKPLSFTDCIIVTSALELNIKYIATFENEFLSLKERISIIQ